MSMPTAQLRVARRRAAARRATRRRRTLQLLAFAAAIACAVVVLRPLFDTAVRDLSLPLRHEAAIRAQARAKGLDPALIAGVIYAESKFNDSTSSAGALGLMQLLPSTADFIAQRSGGTRFTTADLATPDVNIAYGSWYLRYLMNRYRGSVVLTLAAYNGGETNVNRWLAAARAHGRRFAIGDIPFAETRAYVKRVLDARDRYAATYAQRLGIG
jgi:soluble lytic murein transglycosylase